MQHCSSISRASVQSQYNFHATEVASVMALHPGSFSVASLTPATGFLRGVTAPIRPLARAGRLHITFFLLLLLRLIYTCRLSSFVLDLPLTSINDICQSAVVRPLNRHNHHYHDNFQMFSLEPPRLLNPGHVVGRSAIYP